MVHVQTILRGFEAETVGHKQRVDNATRDSFFFFDEAASVLQQYKIASGSKYTLRIYHSFFPCQ